MRQIDNPKQRKQALMLLTTLAASGFGSQALAAPKDAGAGVRGDEAREVAEHSLLLDIDEVAKAELGREGGEGSYDERGVKLGSSVALGANGVLLGGLTLGGLVNLAKSKDGEGERSTLGGALRAGYLISLGGPFTLWPNASIGYSETTTPNRATSGEPGAPQAGELTLHDWQASGEARILAEVAEHVGLTAALKYTHAFATGESFDGGDVHNWYPGKQAVSADLGLAAWF